MPDPSTLKLIIAALLAWLAQNSPYTLPLDGEQPVIEIRSMADIQAEIDCGPECRILGYNAENGRLVIAAEVARRLEWNPCARSVLLHELVHYQQDLKGRFNNLHPILRWRFREKEAAYFQRQWLEKEGRHVQVQYAALGGFTGPAC